MDKMLFSGLLVTTTRVLVGLGKLPRFKKYEEKIYLFLQKNMKNQKKTKK
jgi:hypothetical protein